jgi:hypothetical protein
MPCSLKKIYSVLQETAVSIFQTEVPGHFLPEYVAAPQKKIIFTNNLNTEVLVSTLLSAPLLLPMPRTHAIEAELHF